MKIGEIKESLEAEVLCGEDLMDLEILSGCGADLMSDVLAFVKEKIVLLTGLTNPHVIRTAEMLDVSCIVFVRGKKPTPDILEMATERGIAVLSTGETLFTACGRLYEKGLRGGTGAY
ncbi:DRTGG domain-containing protein [Gehongia tenuis]|uniref:DRTGG domain-containing protein n=1 Tax=Gehongia tenuis TaxID=2763655 RepID=A0A926HP12_9FIRM|nr:DRTGG domain-containing protein [Gehongia tenuis]MBC8530733.1 hypothetical protein [Gehongia tenuis]